MLRDLIEDDNSSFENGAVKVPKSLKKKRQQLLKCPQLMELCEAMVYFIRVLRDCFQGKVEDKLLSKVLKYPKMVLETAWYYVFLFTRQHPYTWSLPSEVEEFLQQHPVVGSYKF